MFPTVGDDVSTTPDDLSRARALDLLSEQRRRIVALTGRVSAGQRTLEQSATAPGWRAPSGVEFELRLTDLRRALASSSGSLQAALLECDRARDVLRAGLLSGPGVAESEKAFIGYPAGAPRR